MIEYAARSGQLEAAASIAAQTGAEIRSVMALMACDRMSFLFTADGVLRRIDTASPVVAKRYLRDRARRWELREATAQRGWAIEACRQCSYCGFGAGMAEPAGGNGLLCRRCGSDLTPTESTKGWATVLIGSHRP